MSGDDLDWSRNSGGTPSNGTGPSTGADGSWYMYIETSGNGTGYPNKTAGLESPCFDLTGLSNPEFSFQYHMLGSAVGNLQVQVSTDGTNYTTVRTISGDQGSAWGSETIDMSAYGSQSEVRIRFFGTSGTSWQGDIAVDDISMASGGGGNPSCGTTISSFPYGESFESGVGAWSQVSGDDLDWTRDASGTPSTGTGPTTGADGSWYMYIEASGNGTGYPNKTAVFESPCFDLSGVSNPSFNFSYHMYSSGPSSDVGTLLVQGSTDGTNYTTLQTISGSQGNSWNTASIDLSSFGSSTGFSIRFQGTTAATWRGDIAIDDVSVTSGSAGPSCADVTVTINLDNYPEETSWEITQGATVVASGGTYGSQPDGSTVTVTECLPDGCYDFTIFDAFGDGICCGYGNGSYTVTGGGNTVASGGSFGSSETTNFCVSGNSVASLGVTATTTSNFSIANKKYELNVYPNPVLDKLNFNYGEKDASFEARILDMSGRTIWSGKVSGGNSTLDASDFPSGVYFLQIQDNDKVKVEKFVKE
ncbi:MAG: T9SS type A sorting domain-containing protein [Bacteroidia bacterium]|nr:T9SS type A sorting domain-containing protein [Bacteroidia bacterium]